MADTDRDALRDRLVTRFRRGVDEPLDDPAFNSLALEVFRHQLRHNRPYAAYCQRRGRTADTVGHWREIPAVPTAAFKEVPLVAGQPERAERVFRTSGTTRGPERRGRHYLLDRTLYEASLLPTFEAHLLPDGARPVLLSLIPPLRVWPDSSLAYMVGAVVERFGAAGSGFHADGDGLDHDALEAALDAAMARDEPVGLLGTSAAFVHWLDRLDERGRRLALPDGSRLMDTGGYKGRGRDVPESRLRDDYERLLGIRRRHAINEYGMTELLSQAYDSTLRDHARGLHRPRRKLAPPWMRTIVVEPDTLEPVPPGETGILRHLDLANLDSVACIQTEDLGHALDDGFVVHGRIAGATPRGCSIAMDLLLREETP